MNWKFVITVLPLSLLCLAGSVVAEETAEAKPATETAPAAETKAATESTSEAKPEVKLPSAEQVIDDYIKATGGEAARRQVKSRKMIARLTFPTANINADVVEYAQAPNFIYRESKIENLGTSRAGSDGKVSWMIDAITGPQVLEGEALAFNLRMTRFYHELDWKKIYKSAETTAIEAVDGKPCYKVVFTPETGDPLVNYYDKESKLLVRTDVTIPLVLGKVSVESYMGEYKDFAGVKVPTKTTMKMRSQQRVLEIKEIDVNCEIPAGTFDIPEVIQEVIAKQKEKPKEKSEEKVYVPPTQNQPEKPAQPEQPKQAE